MLYSSNEIDDFANILASIDGFAEGFGLESLDVDENAIETILRGMRQDFPAQGGSPKASPFKKAANFLCYFVSLEPVKNPFPAHLVGKDIADIPNHQNAMIALHIAFDALHHSKIYRSDTESITLENRIALSRHSYTDLIQACHRAAPSSHFHMVSVLLEQMCYRNNPEASYELVI